MAVKVVGYIRVSTMVQVKDGYSLTYQVDEIRQYCQQHNLELVQIYEDRGISGAKVDEDDLTVEREGLQNMLADLKTTGARYVLVFNTSRLWRSDMVKVLIHRELKRHKVDVKAIEQPNYSIYAHDPNDFLVNGMLELLDQYQRLEITSKLSRGRRKKAEQGGYAGGGVAYGYTLDKGSNTLEVNEPHANTVRRVFELRRQYPTWSLSQLAAELNADGYTTKQGRPFSKVHVKRILDRECQYKGMVKYGNVVAQGHHQAII